MRDKGKRSGVRSEELELREWRCAAGVAVIVLGFLMSCGMAAGEDDEFYSSGVLILTLEECEGTALERNLAVQRAEVGLEAAHAAVKEAKATILPQVDLASRYTRLGPRITFEVPTPEGTEEVTVGRELDRNASLELSQPVYAVGPMKLARRAARVGVGLFEAALANAQDEVIWAVRKAFFNCLRAQALLEVAKQRQGQAKAHLKNAVAFHQAGTAARVDVLRAQVEMANADHLVLAAQNGVDLAFIALRNLLNLGQEVSLKLNVPQLPKLVELELERCLEEAEVRRADLRRAAFGVELAKAKEALVAAERKPTVFLFGNRQWKTGTAFAPETSWSVSLVASVPIFDAGAGDAKQQRARKETQQGEIDLQTLEQMVGAEVRAAFLSLEASRKQLAAAQVAREQAQEALRITELQYEEGMARTIEVLDAEVALAQAATNYVNAVYDYETAKAELARAAGVYSVEEFATEAEKNPPGAVMREEMPLGKEG